MNYSCKLLICCFLICLASCSGDETASTRFSFYHWKAKAKTNEQLQTALADSKAQHIYLHYFDVEVTDQYPYAYPVSVLTDVDEAYKDFQIIPVIYLVNQVFKGNADLNLLAENTVKLIQQINEAHFDKITPSTVQLDCDWTARTKDRYFEFIELLKQHYNISVTIRLHQIKYQERSGIPNVAQGTLMLYNMGDLKAKKGNSIIDPNIVAAYINENSNYPLKLRVALPLFSQLVVRNNDQDIRLIAGANRKELEADQAHFKQVDEQTFEVVADLLFKGMYLFKGYQIKLEESTMDAIVDAYEVVQNSQLDHEGITFYHLDKSAINSLDFKNLLEQL